MQRFFNPNGSDHRPLSAHPTGGGSVFRQLQVHGLRGAPQGTHRQRGGAAVAADAAAAEAGEVLGHGAGHLLGTARKEGQGNWTWTEFG